MLLTQQQLSYARSVVSSLSSCETMCQLTEGQITLERTTRRSDDRTNGHIAQTTTTLHEQTTIEQSDKSVVSRSY